MASDSVASRLSETSESSPPRSGGASADAARASRISLGGETGYACPLTSGCAGQCPRGAMHQSRLSETSESSPPRSGGRCTHRGRRTVVRERRSRHPSVAGAHGCAVCCGRLADAHLRPSGDRTPFCPRHAWGAHACALAQKRHPNWGWGARMCGLLWQTGAQRISTVWRRAKLAPATLGCALRLWRRHTPTGLGRTNVRSPIGDWAQPSPPQRRRNFVSPQTCLGWRSPRAVRSTSPISAGAETHAVRPAVAG